MGRKKVSEMTPEELAAYRKYMAQKKAESRARRSEPEKDLRTYEDRRDYLRSHKRRSRELIKKKAQLRAKIAESGDRKSVV